MDRVPWWVLIVGAIFVFIVLPFPLFGIGSNTGGSGTGDFVS
jgi:hypothetical protein